MNTFQYELTYYGCVRVLKSINKSPKNRHSPSVHREKCVYVGTIFHKHYIFLLVSYIVIAHSSFGIPRIFTINCEF